MKNKVELLNHVNSKALFLIRIRKRKYSKDYIFFRIENITFSFCFLVNETFYFFSLSFLDHHLFTFYFKYPVLR